MEGAGGATRWLNVGIRIQPSEIGKIILLIITLSQYISERYLQLDRLSTVFRTMLHVAIPAGLIFAQPDLGTTIVFLVHLGSYYLVGGFAHEAHRLIRAGDCHCPAHHVSRCCHHTSAAAWRPSCIPDRRLRTPSTTSTRR